MESKVNFKDIAISTVAILLVYGLAVGIKKLLYKYKRPNGKKGGIISLHVAVAFAIVAVIAMSVKDWFVTLLAVVLAYLIAKGRMDEGQHYLYQIIFSAIIGLAVPYGAFYLYYRQLNPFASRSSDGGDRPDIEDKPERAKDDREEADREGGDLRLDD